MKIHPRTQMVMRAGTRMQLLLLDEQERWELTDIEMLSVLSSLQQTFLKYLLKNERHSENPESQADTLYDENEI